MLISYSWLKTFLPKCPPVPKLVDLLMMHGLEVERVVENHSQYGSVVVGQVTAIKPHPNADKLRLVDVRLKAGAASQEIVCGAPNIAVGQKVLVALVGAKLPNGLAIEPRAIRGVTSNGMICAADELGFGVDHSGIMVLDPNTKLGTPLDSLLSDTVLDIAVPSNRADLSSMRGLAREIAAVLGQKPVFTVAKVSESKTPVSALIRVEVTDQTLNPLLTMRVIRGLQSRPSPLWLIQRLRANGMRPVSLIVDVTNLMMLEYGQPLHAYDADQLRGGRLIARRAKNGERLITLDGKERQLTSDMLIICDAERPVDLAGVMGGENTAVTEATTTVALEAGIFSPVAVRKTSRQLGLVSEASKRFERGLWPELTLQAVDAAAALLAELGSGVVEQGRVAAGTTASPARVVVTDPAYISQRLGMKISAAAAKKALQQLGFRLTGTKQWQVTVPPWRLDVTQPEDVVDEVGRMVGYEKLPKVMPTETTAKELPKAIRFKHEIRNILVAAGYTEIISHAFYSQAESKAIQGEHFAVANPLDSTQHWLRKSLVPQLYNVLDRQADAGRDAKVFEIGRIFDPGLGNSVEDQQPWKLAIGICGKERVGLEGEIDLLQKKLGTEPTIDGEMESREPNRGRHIRVAQFDLNELISKGRPSGDPWDPDQYVKEGVRVVRPSKYPIIERDIAFWWTAAEEKILSVLDGLHIDLIQGTEITDRFAKDGHTSYTITIRYQAPDRTLTKAEVDGLEVKIKAALEAQGATIR